jgi:hypothetical protein
MRQPLQALLLIIGLAVAVFAVLGALFVYWAKGLAVGTYEANVFLAWVLGFAAIAGATWWFWRWSRPPNKHPDS